MDCSRKKRCENERMRQERKPISFEDWENTHLQNSGQMARGVDLHGLPRIAGEHVGRRGRGHQREEGQWRHLLRSVNRNFSHVARVLNRHKKGKEKGSTWHFFFANRRIEFWRNSRSREVLEPPQGSIAIPKWTQSIQRGKGRSHQVRLDANNACHSRPVLVSSRPGESFSPLSLRRPEDLPPSQVSSGRERAREGQLRPKVHSRTLDVP